MGQAEIHQSAQQLIIRSVFYFYGDAASQSMAIQVADDIAYYWNAAKGQVKISKKRYEVQFNIEGIYEPALKPETVWYNIDSRYNYFRIEEFSIPDISFVDGINCNTGYFKAGNLLNKSTTAAHEYGHTLGLDHPKTLDIRGKGQPGIMYPRGTICDPEFQYDPTALALQAGGTMNPYTRKVLQTDIDHLKLHRLSFNEQGLAVVGGFSSVYHEKHVL